MQSIVFGQESGVVVMPTGSGKSLLFMLPAYLASEIGRFYILVVPINALIDDLEERLTEKQIRYKLFEEGLSVDNALDYGLIIVHLDKACHDSFSKFVQSAMLRNSVSAIFF